MNKRFVDCQECQQLWRDYTRLTNALLIARAKLRNASMTHQETQIVELSTALEEAHARQQLARAAIVEHEYHHMAANSANA